MKPRLLAIIVVVVAAALAGGLVYQKRQTPQAQREQLVAQFIAILPDTLSNDHILEIRQLFYVLRERASRGDVKPQTIEEIMKKVQVFVDRGRISKTDLVHLMAEVGHSTYKDDPRYNLPDGSVDHPELNPEAGMVPLRFDSTQFDSSFWAGYKVWKKEHGEDFADSVMMTNPRLRPQP